MMHAPDTNATASFHGLGKKTRKEREADAFALCALIPRSWIETRDAAELADDGFTVEIMQQRIEVYRDSGL
jgi:hypothetical protein